MIELQHLLPEPPELSKYRANPPDFEWRDDLPFKSAVREQLYKEQDGFCVYCETAIDSEKNNHIEHIKPRSRFRNGTFQYANMAVSCNNLKHCGWLKADKVLPIEPAVGCNRFFDLMVLDGRIVPALDLSDSERENAVKTIQILGLNVPALVRQRQGYIQTLHGLSVTDGRNFVDVSPFRWSLRKLLESQSC